MVRRTIRGISGVVSNCTHDRRHSPSASFLVAAVVLSLSAVQTLADSDVITLAGQWRFLMNGPSPGADQQALPELEFPDTIMLPGTTETRQKGPQNTERWTGGLTRHYRFDGPAWYQRGLTIPETWRGKRVVLFLERTKYTQVWLDDQPCGDNPILCTPQEYVLGNIEPGTHRLTIVVDNTRRPVTGEMHQMSDNTQGNWNGIIGRLELRATDPVWLDDIQVYPDISAKTIRVTARIGNITGKPSRGVLSIAVAGEGISREPSSSEIAWDGDGGEAEIQLPLGDSAKLWDEFRPVLHRLKVEFESDSMHDERAVTFGLRDFRAKGSQFVINGRTTFLRGKNDCCIFPVTGHPPMDVGGWLKYLGTCRDYGINYIRCHTWTPPEAAFVAADQLGMYLEPELPFWGEYREQEQRALMPEARRIMKCLGNHPSFVAFSLGNECRGSREVMEEMVTELRALDPRHLYAQGSNNFLWDPRLSEGDDFWMSARVHNTPGGPAHNIRGSHATLDNANGHVQIGPPNTMKDYSEAIDGIPVPVIGHEIAQYTFYPDFREIEKYTGVFRARNLEHFRDKLAAAGTLDQADDFFRASGKLSVLCYREEIETALRTPGFGGFHLLDIQDFPGQGTALVGVLDAFMDSKGAITPEQWRQFCGPVVLLARSERYTWTADDTFIADIQVAHHGKEDLPHAVLEWALCDAQGRRVSSGALPAQTVRQGGVRSLGKVSASLDAVSAPAGLTLRLQLRGSDIETSYPLWVYPARVSTEVPDSVTFVRSFDADARRALGNGGRVLLMPQIPPGLARTVGGGFTTDFWCWPMFYNRPGTMGLLCDPNHPALAAFPTDYHTDWQWFHIVVNSQPLILDALPRDYRPLIQVVDNLDRVHRLGLVFEAIVGRGRLLVCSADLLALSDKPEARQLLHSLLQYAGSEHFNPRKVLTVDALRDLLLIAGPTTGRATASPSGRTSGWRPSGPAQAFDGVEQTLWSPGKEAEDMWWKIEFDQAADLDGAEVVWATDNTGYQYLLEGSVDGSTWRVLSDQRRNELAGVHRLNFSARGLRSVRITVIGIPENTMAGIREVRFFGAQ